MASSVTLRRGTVTIPNFGLGTRHSKSEEAKTAVSKAFEVGYTLIDTACMYENEESIGQALKGRTRESYTLVTKLMPTEEQHKDVEGGLRTSLEKLGVDYVDLYLVHSPGPGNVVDVWKNMLRLRDMGLAKAVGVSNFGWKQIAELEKLGLELPEVNQIEFHIMNNQKEHVEWMKAKNITLMGYCPLMQGKRWGDLGGSSTAEEAKWMLCWSMAQGAITIPKTVKLERIQSNWDDTREPLSPELLAKLDSLNENWLCSNSVKNMDKPWDEVACEPFTNAMKKGA